MQEVKRNCGASCRRIYAVFQPEVSQEDKTYGELDAYGKFLDGPQ